MIELHKYLSLKRKLEEGADPIEVVIAYLSHIARELSIIADRIKK